MGLTHWNIFDILEPTAFQKYSICWVFHVFFCSTLFYMYFATQPCPSLTAVSNIRQCSWHANVQKTWSDLHIWEGFITSIVISMNKKGAKTCVKYKWGNQTGMMGSSGAPGTVFGSRFWQQHTYVIKVSLTQAVALNI